MKAKISILLTGMFLTYALAGHSTILRVNNNPNIIVPYTTIVAAYNAANSGDTLYLEGSATTYGNLTITKKVTIIGTGYFLSQNPETQANLNPSSVAVLSIPSTGANGTKIMGLEIYEVIFSGVNNIQDVEISRNYITNVLRTLNVYIYNATISQNYINSMTGWYDNSFIRNNYFGVVNIYSPANTLTFFNNVIASGLTLNNVLCSNNILTSGSCTLTNTMTSNNICSGTQFPAGNSNQLNVNMSDVFVCWSNCTGFSSDGRYQLKTGSPAIGAGSNGEDCGMFGGNAPYLLSGLPAIPAIYFFQYNNNNSTINVTMSAKSHN